MSNRPTERIADALPRRRLLQAAGLGGVMLAATACGAKPAPSSKPSSGP